MIPASTIGIERIAHADVLHPAAGELGVGLAGKKFHDDAEQAVANQEQTGTEPVGRGLRINRLRIRKQYHAFQRQLVQLRRVTRQRARYRIAIAIPDAFGRQRQVFGM